MDRKSLKRNVTFAALLVMLLASAGCSQWLLATHAASFGAGWLLRDVTMTVTVEKECYQNGELVDCSTLP